MTQHIDVFSVHIHTNIQTIIIYPSPTGSQDIADLFGTL